MKLVMRPYRKLFANMAALPYHATMFRLVAKVGPVVWLGSLMAGNLASGLWVLDNVKSDAATAVCGVLGVSAFLWLASFWFVAPAPGNPGVLCNTKPGRVLSAHLEGEMSGIDLKKGAESTLNLARSVGAKRIDLYSPLFGRPEKEKVWLNWFKGELARLAPGAVVTVTHRKPLSRYVSFAYRCQYGKDARATFKDGRVQAACFSVTGF